MYSTKPSLHSFCFSFASPSFKACLTNLRKERDGINKNTLNQDWEHRAHTHKVITKEIKQIEKKKKTFTQNYEKCIATANTRRQEETETNDKTNKICVQLGLLYHIVRLLYNWHENKKIKRTQKWNEMAWIELKTRTIFTFGYIFNQLVAYAFY